MPETRDTAFWTNAPREERPKTMEEFREEVKAKIGMDIDSIPKGTPEDMIGGASLLAFENMRVVGVGYPDKDEETGEETYREFKLIDMSDVKE